MTLPTIVHLDADAFFVSCELALKPELRGTKCAVGGRERKESRGAQFRTDYPERNDGEWLKHIDVSRNGDASPHLSYSPVTITQWQPEERKY